MDREGISTFNKKAQVIFSYFQKRLPSSLFSAKNSKKNSANLNLEPLGCTLSIGCLFWFNDAKLSYALHAVYVNRHFRRHIKMT